MLSWWKVTKPLQSQPVIKVFLTHFIGVSQRSRTFLEEFNQDRYLDYLLQHPVLSIRSRTESRILLYTVKVFNHIYQNDILCYPCHALPLALKINVTRQTFETYSNIKKVFECQTQNEKPIKCQHLCSVSLLEKWTAANCIQRDHCSAAAHARISAVLHSRK